VTGLTALAAATLLFLSIGPMLLPFQVFSVLSGSMEPNIHKGALVVVTRAPAASIRVGDVITFQPPARSSFVTHRVFSLDPGSSRPTVTTKGDANSAADAWSLALPESVWRFQFSVPFLGYFLVLAQSGFGRVALVLLPAIGLAYLYLADEIRPRRIRSAA